MKPIQFPDFLKNPGQSASFVMWLKKWLDLNHYRHGTDHRAGGIDPIPAGQRYYATPISPASTPSDYLATAPYNAAFAPAALNTVLPDASYSPLCWYFTPGGKKRIEGAIDGVPIGGTIVTLPEPFWPETDYTGPILSADGTTQMGVSISSTTGVVTLTEPTAAVLGTGVVETSMIANNAVTEAQIGLSDVLTDNVSTSKHGFAPKGTGTGTKYLDDTGAYSTPSSGITQLTGDVTAGPGSGSQAATLAASGVSANTYGDNSHVPQITIDAKGRITSASSVAISGVVGGIAQSYIGYNTVGGTTDTMGSAAYKQIYKQVTLSLAGLLVSIDVYCKGNASSVSALFAAVFDDNSGAPGKTIGIQAAETNTSVTNLSAVLSTTPRWVSIPMTMWLPAGTYWLVVIGGFTGTTFYYDGSGGDYTNTTAATWGQGEITAPSNSSRKYSVRGSLCQ